MRIDSRSLDAVLVPAGQQWATMSQRHQQILKVAVFLVFLGIILTFQQANVDVYNAVSKSDKNDFVAPKGTTNRKEENDIARSSPVGNDTNAVLIPPEPTDGGVMHVNESIVLMPGEISPLANCSPTTQIRVKLESLESGGWLVQALDSRGRAKTSGGDEFYIAYDDWGDPDMHATGTDHLAVSMTEDLGNGQYRLDFVMPPGRVDMTLPHFVKTGYGRLTVYFEYTCGIGYIARPGKRHWKNSGACRVRYLSTNVPAPPMRRYQKPTNIHLSTYESVVCFGDSIMGNLCGKYWSTNVNAKSNIHVKGKVGSELSLPTVDEFMDKLQRSHGKLLSNSTDPDRTAILLGSAVWDLLEPKVDDERQGLEFRDHLEACRQLISRVREKYPRVTIYWKLPQAIHVHELEPSCYNNKACRHRTKYMSNSLLVTLHKLQKQLMEELQVTCIDFYEATYLSAAWLMPGDGRHYRMGLNELLLNYTYGHA